MFGSRTLSFTISMPDKEISNDFWLQNYPQTVKTAEQNNWMWKSGDVPDRCLNEFEAEMAPYMQDPFRGAKFRRFLPPDEKLITLEKKAAAEAIELANLSPDDIDLVLCATFPPDEAVIGNASLIAADIGSKGDAWNIESACSGWAVAFITAHRLIQSGQYQSILVVASCGYSKTVDLASPLSWGVGDAAAACVIVSDNESTELMGTHGVHTGHTYGAVRFDLEPVDGKIYRRLRVGKSAREHLGATMGKIFEACVNSALQQSEVALEDIKFCLFSSPLAWYPAYCVRYLGLDYDKTLNTYPLYGNIGPVLPAVNLYHALYERKVYEDDLILIYSVGSVSSCRAMVLRWGSVAVGQPPSRWKSADASCLLHDESSQTIFS